MANVYSCVLFLRDCAHSGFAIVIGEIDARQANLSRGARRHGDKRRRECDFQVRCRGRCATPAELADQKNFDQHQRERLHDRVSENGVCNPGQGGAHQQSFPAKCQPRRRQFVRGMHRSRRFGISDDHAQSRAVYYL